MLGKKLCSRHFTANFQVHTNNGMSYDETKVKTNIQIIVERF